MTGDDQHRLDIWRKEVASHRPLPTADVLARLRPLIAAALPRAAAAPARTGAAATASSAPAAPQETKEGTPE